MGQISSAQLISLNKHASFRLKLKLFQATVIGAGAKIFAQSGRGTTTDVVVCWLGSHACCTLGNHNAKKNQRMEHVAALHPLPSWSNQYFVKQYRLATKIASN